MIRINEIEQAAQALNLSLLDLCRMAKVEFSTVRRWQKGEQRPLLAKWEDVQRRLVAALGSEAERLRAHLSGPVMRQDANCGDAGNGGGIHDAA